MSLDPYTHVRNPEEALAPAMGPVGAGYFTHLGSKPADSRSLQNLPLSRHIRLSISKHCFKHLKELQKALPEVFPTLLLGNSQE